MSVTVTYDSASQPQTNTKQSAWDETYHWLLGWGVALILLTLLNKTRLGHVFIYYWLCALILFLVVTQYKFIIAAIGPVGQPAPGGNNG